jgi:hypothetical protein
MAVSPCPTGVCGRSRPSLRQVFSPKTAPSRAEGEEKHACKRDKTRSANALRTRSPNSRVCGLANRVPGSIYLLGMRRPALLLIALSLSFPPSASADAVGDRIAAEVERTNAHLNTEEFTPTVYHEWSTSCGEDQKVYLHQTDNPDAQWPYEWSWPPAALVDRMEVVGVPLPCYFEPAAGSDQESVIFWHGDKSAGQGDYYEFWGAQWKRRYDQTYGWSTRWGAAVDENEMGIDPASGARYFTDGQGAQASGIAFFPGVITVDDLERGEIDHIVALQVPEACGWEDIRFPAQRTDGWGSMSTNEWCVPYGVHVKLPQSAQPGPYASRFVKILVQEAKDYGFDVTDQNHWTVGVRAENWKRPYAPWGDEDPYARLLVGPWCVDHPDWWSCYPDKYNAFGGFPWDQLHVVP